MRIGITGHRHLKPEETKWIKNEIEIEIKQLNIHEAYSCLAIGSDQIFAGIILSKRIPLIAIIPCIDYEKTFNKIDLLKFNKLFKHATSTIQLEFQNPTDYAFLEAGKAIVNLSDIIFAVWNDLPAKGLGGTADIVSIANSLNKKIIHFNPITRTKKFINYG